MSIRQTLAEAELDLEPEPEPELVVRKKSMPPHPRVAARSGARAEL